MRIYVVLEAKKKKADFTNEVNGHQHKCKMPKRVKTDED